MEQHASIRNPFMLLLQPEVIFAAIEKSEHLSQLNRHLCRPLDKPVPGSAAFSEGAADEDEAEDSSAR